MTQIASQGRGDGVKQFQVRCQALWIVWFVGNLHVPSLSPKIDTALLLLSNVQQV